VTTISDGTTTVTPLLITGWETTRDAQNVLHVIIGRADHDVTYRPAGWANGTLEFLFPNLEAALVCEALLSQGKKFTLVDTDHSVLNMTFVASGAIGVTLDDETRLETIVSVDFQEVAP